MKSKKFPLWLVFNRANNKGKYTFLFKHGDDMRQDMLTLQLLKAMDEIWQSKGLDLQLKPYSVVATGIGSGGEVSDPLSVPPFYYNNDFNFHDNQIK